MLWKRVLEISAVLISTGAALAQGGATKEVKIGTIAPFSGAVAAFSSITKTQSAFFDMINQSGGLTGAKIKFVPYDDGYVPAKTVEMARKLVESDEVDFLFGIVGTPGNAAILKYTNGRKIPAVFVATASSKIGANPKEYPWTIGLQPAGDVEGAIFARHVLTSNPDAKIAVLYQNDDFGRDGLKGLRDALGEKANTVIVSATSYEPADPTVDSAVVVAKHSGADAYILFATPKFMAQAIRKVGELGWKPMLIAASGGSSVQQAMIPAGPAYSTGTLTMSYFKDPSDPQWKNDSDVRDYLAFMSKYNPQANALDIFNVYGYLAANTLLDTLKRCELDFSHENVMAKATSIESLSIPMLQDGIKVSTSKEDYRPIKNARMARFDGENWVAFGPVLGR